MPDPKNKKFTEKQQKPALQPPNLTARTGKLEPVNYKKFTEKQSRIIKPRTIQKRPALQQPNLTAKVGKLNPVKMEGSPLYGKISSSCKAAAKRKFKVWPSAYASGWGVRCTKAGGPGNFGDKKK